MNLNNAPRARPQVGQAAPHPQRTHGPPCTFTQPYAELALAISRPMAHTRPCSRRNRAHGMTPWSSPLLFTIDSPPPGRRRRLQRREPAHDSLRGQPPSGLPTFGAKQRSTFGKLTATPCPAPTHVLSLSPLSRSCRHAANTRPRSRGNCAQGPTPLASALLFTIDFSPPTPPPPPGGGGGGGGGSSTTTHSPSLPRELRLRPDAADKRTTLHHRPPPPLPPGGGGGGGSGGSTTAHSPSLPRELRPRPDAAGKRTTLHHRPPPPPPTSGRRRRRRRRRLYHRTLALAPEGTAPKARRR